MTRYGLTEMKRAIQTTGMAPEPQSFDEHWTAPHPAEIDVAPALTIVKSWADDSEIRDATYAAALHQAMPLPRRVAADRMIWPWLACVVLRDYTLRRYPPDDGHLNLDRFDSSYVKNAAARLWWSAELVRTENARELCKALDLPSQNDPYFLLAYLFRNPSIHQELTYRIELTDRTTLAALLAYIHHEQLAMKDLGGKMRDVNLLFSTVLADAFSAGPEPFGHRVDPRACRNLLELLRRNLGTRGDFGHPEESSKASADKPGLIARMFRRR